MILLLILAIIVGLLQAYCSISDVKRGRKSGTPNSSSLIDFVFFNR